jgi:hypothetical protein
MGFDSAQRDTLTGDVQASLPLPPDVAVMLADVIAAMPPPPGSALP